MCPPDNLTPAESSVGSLCSWIANWPVRLERVNAFIAAVRGGPEFPKMVTRVRCVRSNFSRRTLRGGRRMPPRIRPSICRTETGAGRPISARRRRWQSNDERISLAEWFNDLVYSLFIQACFADPIYGGNANKVFWKAIGYPGLPAVNGINIVKYRGKPFPEAQTPKSIEDFS